MTQKQVPNGDGSRSQHGGCKITFHVTFQEPKAEKRQFKSHILKKKKRRERVKTTLPKATRRQTPGNLNASLWTTGYCVAVWTWPPAAASLDAAGPLHPSSGWPAFHSSAQPNSVPSVSSLSRRALSPDLGMAGLLSFFSLVPPQKGPC